MALFVLLALAVLAGASAQNARIVSGDQTSIDQYPSVVQVDFLSAFSNTWSQNCAGIILNQLFVLSAAQCFAGTFYSPDRRRIRAGSSNRNTGGILLDIQFAVNHPDFGDKAEYDSDLTVIRLATYLTYSPVVQPATIMAQGYELPDGSAVVQAGWGYTEENGYSSPDLLKINVNTINREECAARYEERETEGVDFRVMDVTENMICTGDAEEGTKDACTGDFGGPTMYGDILVGLISWGNGCGDANWPRVSTRISAFTNWIVQNAQ